MRTPSKKILRALAAMLCFVTLLAAVPTTVGADSTADSISAQEAKLKSLSEKADEYNKKLKESKAENVIDKIPVDELPNCEQIDVNNSKIGDFISKEQFEELYDDEKGELLGGLKKDGDMLAYCINGSTTWWKRRIEEEGGNGLVRIK